VRWIVSSTSIAFRRSYAVTGREAAAWSTSIVVDRRPWIFARQPSIVDRRSSTIDRGSSLVNHRPWIVARQPSIVDRRSSTIDRRPSLVNHRPSCAVVLSSQAAVRTARYRRRSPCDELLAGLAAPPQPSHRRRPPWHRRRRPPHDVRPPSITLTWCIWPADRQLEPWKKLDIEQTPRMCWCSYLDSSSRRPGASFRNPL
jgi:hypothetical protein